MHMNFSESLLLVPTNDAEAILVFKIAQVIGLSILISSQRHGATLDAEKGIVAKLKKRAPKTLYVLEMPGVKTEEKIRALGIELVIIDHHHYTDLDRAHDARGNLLPSSLEQFLKLFRLTDKKLIALGFEPQLVRGIGVLDRGFVWALYAEGYTKKEVRDVLAYHDSLITPLIDVKKEALKQRQTLAAWKARKVWKGFFLVSTRAKMSLRPRLSRLVALERGKPTALIILEPSRGLLYVQESDFALRLLARFGGFTFGLDRNWGYQNESGKPVVTLKMIQEVICA